MATKIYTLEITHVDDPESSKKISDVSSEELARQISQPFADLLFEIASRNEVGEVRVVEQDMLKETRVTFTTEI